jgi:hypothetical protein
VTTAVQRFDPGTNEATVIESDPWPGRTPAGCVSLPGSGVISLGVDNWALVIGGLSFASAGCVDDQSAETWWYNPTAPAGSRWSRGATLSVARGYVTAIWGENGFYAIGGDTISGGRLSPVATVEVNDDRGWEDAAAADLPIPCDESQAFAWRDTVVLAGCGQWPGATPDVFLYDTNTNQWSSGGTLNEARRNHA